MDEIEFLSKVGITVGDFVLQKLTRRYQNQQQLENEISNVLKIMEVDIDVNGIATFLANNGYITIIGTNIVAKEGFELGSKKGGFDFTDSSIQDGSGTGIKAIGKGTGIKGRGNVSIKTKKGNADFNVG